MRHVKFFGVISLVFCFVLTFMGCTTGKNQLSGIDVGLKAEAVREGIRLSFDYIPPETNRIFVHLTYWGEGEEPSDHHQLLSSYSDIMGSSLDQVKQSREVIFPFVRTNFEYHIAVSFQNAEYEAINGMPELFNTVCIAENNGIFVENDIALELNENHTSVTLSSQPIFSHEVSPATENYSFIAIIYEANIYGADVSMVEKRNDLSWDFEPQMSNGFKDVMQDSETGHYLVRGTYPTVITVHSNIMHDNIRWEVEIAKSREFTFTL